MKSKSTTKKKEVRAWAVFTDDQTIFCEKWHLHYGIFKTKKSADEYRETCGIGHLYKVIRITLLPNKKVK